MSSMAGSYASTFLRALHSLFFIREYSSVSSPLRSVGLDPVRGLVSVCLVKNWFLRVFYWEIVRFPSVEGT